MDKLREWLEAKGIEDIDEGVKIAQSVADAEVSRIVAKHDDEFVQRFNGEKLPKILEEERGKIRAELQKELNPEETPEQKRIRELEEKLAKGEQEKARAERRAELRRKASELGVDAYGLSPDDIESLADLGDSAEPVLQTLVDRLGEKFNSQLDARVKERFTKSAPSGGDANLDEVAKLRASGNEEAAQRMQLKSIYESAKKPAV